MRRKKKKDEERWFQNREAIDVGLGDESEKEEETSLFDHLKNAGRSVGQGISSLKKTYWDGDASPKEVVDPDDDSNEEAPRKENPPKIIKRQNWRIKGSSNEVKIDDILVSIYCVKDKDDESLERVAVSECMGGGSKQVVLTPEQAFRSIIKSRYEQGKRDGKDSVGYDIRCVSAFCNDLKLKNVGMSPKEAVTCMECFCDCSETEVVMAFIAMEERLNDFSVNGKSLFNNSELARAKKERGTLTLEIDSKSRGQQVGLFANRGAGGDNEIGNKTKSLYEELRNESNASML